MVARIFKSVKRLCLFFYSPTLSGDSGAVLTLSALPVMHHAQRQSQWQCKTMTKGKITPKPHTGSQRSRCKQNTRYCINKQPCNCQAYAPSHTGNPPCSALFIASVQPSERIRLQPDAFVCAVIMMPHSAPDGLYHHLSQFIV